MPEMPLEYTEFLRSKRMKARAFGKQISDHTIHPMLFPFQHDLTRWAIQKGRAAIFADTGLGKTFMQLEWARIIDEKTLIIAPLSVSRQTVREAAKIGIGLIYVRSQAEIKNHYDHKIFITNYEMIEHFDFSQFGAVVLDESSILKSLDGKTRQRLIGLCQNIPYRLCCTATPAPNDISEIANHSEFLGILTRTDMLAMFFVHDDDGYRLKGHAEEPFYKWLASWGMSIRKPSDLGYEDDGYNLPGLSIAPLFVRLENYRPEGQLFFTGLDGITGRLDVRKASIEKRCQAAIDIIVHSQTSCYNIGHEQNRIYAQLGEDPQRTYPIVQGSNEGKAQCAQEGALFAGRDTANSGQETSEGISPEPSREKEVSKAESLRDFSGGIHGNSEETGLPLRDLRIFGYEQSEFLPDGGSLSQDGQSEGVALSELQSRIGKIQGLGGSSVEGNKLSEQWIIWCGLNAEQDLICQLLNDNKISFVSVSGSLSPEIKENRIEKFINKDVQILVSKPSVLGWGMNFQNCHKMVFLGLSDSFEAYYQCIRRCYRFGQQSPVDVQIILSELEDEIYKNVMSKEQEANRMSQKLIENVQQFERSEIGGSENGDWQYKTDTASGKNWKMMLGDSCERMTELEDESIDFSVYSPPFMSLYTYSPSERDLGNSKGEKEFFDQFAFIIRELLRITKPGRITACHVAQIPAMLARDGYIGLKDFRGKTIQAFIDGGWIQHGEVVIDKDPQAQAIRTKSKALLFTQMHKDSSWSRPALSDIILLFRKPGENAIPITPDLSNDLWIEWARPIWYGIKESDTLQYTTAREEKDERHICPLQLGTIERCIRLWSNKGETVFSPFAGIGSEGYVAINQRRKFIGIELKEAYWRVAVRNLENCVSEQDTPTLFDYLKTVAPQAAD